MAEQVMSTLERKQRYPVEVSDCEQTGIRLFKVGNAASNAEISFAEFNPDLDVHTLMAWVGARTSRSDLAYDDIFAEVVSAASEGGKSAGQKLSEVFSGYGHASVADMAPVMLYINNMSMLQAAKAFNMSSTNGGQELSTRYVGFEGRGMPTPPPEIAANSKAVEAAADVWEFLGTRYKSWDTILRQNLNTWLQPQAAELGVTDKHVLSTVKTRSLDVARNWLPAGASTSMCLLVSARHAVDIAGQLMARDNPDDTVLGQHVLEVLQLSTREDVDIQADLARLAAPKYAEGSKTYRDNLRNVGEFVQASRQGMFQSMGRAAVEGMKVELLDLSAGDSFALEYMATAVPSLSTNEALKMLRVGGDSFKEALSDLIFTHHDRYNLMRNAGDVRGLPFEAQMPLGIARDMNRQRAFGRTIVELETDTPFALADQSFGRSWHLDNAEFWQDLGDDWESSARTLNTLLSRLRDALSNVGPIVASAYMDNFMPLGTNVRFFMSAPPTQLHYATDLRSALGGDYGYRHLSKEMIRQAAAFDPVFKHLGAQATQVDPNSAEQLLGRS